MKMVMMLPLALVFHEHLQFLPPLHRLAGALAARQVLRPPRQHRHGNELATPEDVLHCFIHHSFANQYNEDKNVVISVVQCSVRDMDDLALHSKLSPLIAVAYPCQRPSNN